MTIVYVLSGSPLQEPHWLKSINQLTDLDTTSSRLPFVQQFPTRSKLYLTLAVDNHLSSSVIIYGYGNVLKLYNIQKRRNN